ncbi:hypothetical protein MCOR27_005642 [Pyricularia oryzae]|uniref:Uncharacterized protein n=2 Tax=Pyricularia TaxID=48558 RepID=A0ABQ8NYM7_PYRGI|nr:hypothetical protein MCOR01_008644 [Pyricularia oryzae]KAI6303957.1 hypothetical protein MCOR33_000940 [Pyricularia grisea]KAH9439295.1 hypothetical protein MCOR02_002858 [Pyricularia oryzae]KAI6252984.1 hypothetical protein MCOR19_010418 [Pyricularia oryzae]KAI6275112.1 hypothetical protein MCOR26_006170 [Pyricularia oryzae]
MPSIIKTAGLAVAGLAAFASALPSQSRFFSRSTYEKRQAAPPAAADPAGGLTDVDILQFALTLEHLEAAFYQQGFAKFPAAQFQALGATPQQVTDLLGVGASEQAHVTFLQSAIAQAGTKPVQPCKYNFKFTDAAGMLGTASVLESVGVSAYLGAAPLVKDKSILSAAGSILTIEARHQTAINIVSQLAGSPGAFDAPLGPREVFSLAAPFIESCPDGSNLAIKAFPSLAMAPGTKATALSAGNTLNIQSDQAQGAQFCGFTNGQIIGGTAFAPFTAGAGCVIPQNLAGIVYVTLTNQAPLTGKLTEDMIVAGPMVVNLAPGSL